MNPRDGGRRAAQAAPGPDGGSGCRHADPPSFTGEMAEWLKALDSKSSVPARVPGVRIPLSPPSRWFAHQRIAEAFFQGEVTEWPKVHDWKSCVPPKGTVGSNPTLSVVL